MINNIKEKILKVSDFVERKNRAMYPNNIMTFSAICSFFIMAMSWILWRKNDPTHVITQSLVVSAFLYANLLLLILNYNRKQYKSTPLRTISNYSYHTIMMILYRIPGIIYVLTVYLKEKKVNVAQDILNSMKDEKDEN